jgi:hypothetical protein
MMQERCTTREKLNGKKNQGPIHTYKATLRRQLLARQGKPGRACALLHRVAFPWGCMLTMLIMSKEKLYGFRVWKIWLG